MAQSDTIEQYDNMTMTIWDFYGFITNGREFAKFPQIRGWHDIFAARLTVIKERHLRSSKPQKWSHLQSNLRIWQEDKVRLNEVWFVSFDCQMIWWFQMISVWLRTWDIMRSYLKKWLFMLFLFGTGWSDWSCKQGELWTRRTSIIATDNTGQYQYG